MKVSLSRIGFILITLVLLAGVLASCDNITKTTTPSPITITDQMGRTVNLANNTPQRIVSLSPANTEILYALGLGDRIVGVTDYCNYPPEAEDKPSVGAYNTPNLEQLIALNPDLVLAEEEHEADIIPQLESKGIPVIGLKPKSVSEVFEFITLAGKATGTDKKAADLVESLQERLIRVTNKTKNLPDAERPRVFYIIWHEPLWTVGAGTMHDELIQMAGGVNIAHDLTWYTDISLEAVIAANPQVIIAGVGMGTGDYAPLEFAKSEPRLQSTDALKNDAVYPLDMDITSRYGPRLVDALEEFLAVIHPELRDQP